MFFSLFGIANIIYFLLTALKKSSFSFISKNNSFFNNYKFMIYIKKKNSAIRKHYINLMPN
jgi:hypothetical protein